MEICHRVLIWCRPYAKSTKVLKLGRRILRILSSISCGTEMLSTALKKKVKIALFVSIGVSRRLNFYFPSLPLSLVIHLCVEGALSHPSPRLDTTWQGARGIFQQGCQGEGGKVSTKYRGPEVEGAWARAQAVERKRWSPTASLGVAATSPPPFPGYNLLWLSCCLLAPLLPPLPLSFPFPFLIS